MATIEEIIEEFREFAQGESGNLLTMEPTDHPDVEEWITKTLTQIHTQAKGKERERIGKEGWKTFVVVSKDNPDFRISPFCDNRKEAVKHSKKMNGTKVIEVKGFPEHYFKSLSNTNK